MTNPTDPKPKPHPRCPICGAEMVLLEPRPNDNFLPFLGCIDYPECDGWRKLSGGPMFDADRDWSHR